MKALKTWFTSITSTLPSSAQFPKFVANSANHSLHLPDNIFSSRVGLLVVQTPTTVNVGVVLICEYNMTRRILLFITFVHVDFDYYQDASLLQPQGRNMQSINAVKAQRASKKSIQSQPDCFHGGNIEVPL